MGNIISRFFGGFMRDSHKQSLSFFYDLLNDKISINSACSEDDSKQIVQGTYSVVQNLLEKMCEIDNDVKFGETRTVGSFAEGTKICDPFEFDFLVRIEELGGLSLKRDVTIHRSCQGHGNVHINFKPGPDYDLNCGKSKIKRFIHPDTNLLSSSCVFRELSKTIKNAEKEVSDDTKNNKLKLRHNRNKANYGPNLNIYLIWFLNEAEDSFEANLFDSNLISVDITPYVPCPREVLEQWKSCINHHQYEKMLENPDKYVVLVPLSPGKASSCSLGCRGDTMYSCCWRISLAPAEVEAMKGMHPCHKQCYKMFKYLCKPNGIILFDPSKPGPADISKSFSSYVFKQATLHHDQQCTNQHLIYCMQDILDYLLNCCLNKFLPNFFMPSTNTWSTDYFSGELIIPNLLVQQLKESFDKIVLISASVNCDEKEIEQIINNTRDNITDFFYKQCKVYFNWD